MVIGEHERQMQRHGASSLLVKTFQAIDLWTTVNEMSMKISDAEFLIIFVGF